MIVEVEGARESHRQVSMGAGEIVIVEPLARSTGHQSWFASNLARAIVLAGGEPSLVTFDGMHDDADLALSESVSAVSRVSSSFPRWLRSIFGWSTGIKIGNTAAPSTVRWPFQMYLYNQLTTALSVLYACRSIGTGPAVLHLLCPPSWITLCCLLTARRASTKVVITAFASPNQYRGNSALLRRLCLTRTAIIVVQTETLASDWITKAGSDAVRMIPLPCESALAKRDSRGSRSLLGLPVDEPIVAVIGCICPRKGYIELFQALKGMPKTFRVLLAGDTGPWTLPDPGEIAAQAGWLDHTIIRREFVPESLMPALFAAVNVVALLYREPDVSSGILSLCQLYGVPVIATRFGEIGAKVRSEQLGLTADPNDSAEVADALIRVLKGSSNGDTGGGGDTRRPPPGAPGRPALPSWVEIAAAHLSVYRELQNTFRHRGDDNIPIGSSN